METLVNNKSTASISSSIEEDKTEQLETENQMLRIKLKEVEDKLANNEAETSRKFDK